MFVNDLTYTNIVLFCTHLWFISKNNLIIGCSRYFAQIENQLGVVENFHKTCSGPCIFSAISVGFSNEYLTVLKSSNNIFCIHHDSENPLTSNTHVFALRHLCFADQNINRPDIIVLFWYTAGTSG